MIVRHIHLSTTDWTTFRTRRHQLEEAKGDSQDLRKGHGSARGGVPPGIITMAEAICKAIGLQEVLDAMLPFDEVQRAVRKALRRMPDA